LIAAITDQTPPTADSEAAPQRSSARYERSRRGRNQERHCEIGCDHHDERERCQWKGRPALGRVAVADFGGIELADGGCALAYHRIVRRRFDRHRIIPAEAFASRPGRGFNALQPPQAESEHDDRGMMPRPGAANGVVLKNGIGIAFWDCGRPGHGRHREGRSAERDRRGHQPARDVRCAEQGLRHRCEHEKCDEQADPSIGHERAGEHHGEHGAHRAQFFGHELGDGGHRTAVVHQFAEQGAEEEQRKEPRDKIGRIAHEGLSPAGEQGLG
jgi:hypothetical protein